MNRREEVKEQVTLDAYQRVKVAGANFLLPCKCECLLMQLAFLQALLPLADDKLGRWVGNSFPAPAYSSKILHLKDEGD